MCTYFCIHNFNRFKRKFVSNSEISIQFNLHLTDVQCTTKYKKYHIVTDNQK